MPYVVMVDDNYHYMEGDARYKHGEFVDAGVAIDHCRKIVDEYLESTYKPGTAPEDLLASYQMFGEDPFILSVDVTPVLFSAWEYARQRCADLCHRKP